MSIWHHVRQNTARLLFSLAQYIWFLCLYIESEPLVQLGPIHLRECLWNALSRPIAEHRNQASTAARLCYRTLLLTYHFHRDVQVLLFGECDNSASFHLQDVWFIAWCTGCIPCINVSILTLHCSSEQAPQFFFRHQATYYTSCLNSHLLTSSLLQWIRWKKNMWVVELQVLKSKDSSQLLWWMRLQEVHFPCLTKSFSVFQLAVHLHVTPQGMQHNPLFTSHSIFLASSSMALIVTETINSHGGKYIYIYTSSFCLRGYSMDPAEDPEQSVRQNG